MTQVSGEVGIQAKRSTGVWALTKVCRISPSGWTFAFDTSVTMGHLYPRWAEIQEFAPGVDAYGPIPFRTTYHSHIVSGFD